MKSNEQQQYFLSKLKDGLIERQRLNPQFSLRSYARLLGVQAPTLSAILAGKRSLPLKYSDGISAKLGLTPMERKKFIESLLVQKASLSDLNLQFDEESPTVLSEEQHYKIIAEWEHYAILSLIKTKGFKADENWIAARLGINPLQARQAFNRLASSGFIKQNVKKRWVRTAAKFVTSEDVTSQALQKSHVETLQMAAEKLTAIPVEDRDFSSHTIAANPAKMKEAKQLIRRFENQLAELLEEGEKTEVFQISIQMFPLTNMSKTKEKREK